MKSSEIEKLRKIINSEFGKSFLSDKPVSYKERSKFVQQGHEAVTPTELEKKTLGYKN